MVYVELRKVIHIVSYMLVQLKVQSATLNDLCPLPLVGKSTTVGAVRVVSAETCVIRHSTRAAGA